MPAAADSLGGTSFLVRRKVLKIFGGAFHIYDAAGNVVLYSKMKAFRLREDVRLYTGEDMSQEVLSIQARSIIDFGVTRAQLRNKPSVFASPTRWYPWAMRP